MGQIWSTVDSAFGAYATADYAEYDISMSEQGTASNFYAGSFPTAIAAGVYSVVVKQQIGGSVAETDPTVANGDVHWDGDTVVANSDLATSGQVGQFLPLRFFRGQMVQNFLFKLVSSADHVTSFTSGIVSGQIARDAGSFGALQSGAAAAGYVEVGLGWYRTNLTSGDLLANSAALSFTAVGVSGGSADQRDFALFLQRTSGQTVT